MPLVSLEQDRKYRRVGERYVEICVGCGREHEGDAEHCACGTAFAKPTSIALKLRWDPTKLEPVIPTTCPHCDRPMERTRTIRLALPTKYGGGGATWSGIVIHFGTCKRVPPPWLSWLGVVVSGFFVVVFGLAALFGKLVALVPLGVALVALVACWRAYSWLRFVRFDHRSIRLRARRSSYARALADENGGRVL